MNIKHLNIIKRRKKYLEFYLEIPPRSKEKTSNKSEIQQIFIDRMKAFNKIPIKTDIAVQIIVHTVDRKSPSVSKFAKNIIDIMHKRFLNNDEIQLPFIDDKQIKYLLVKYIYSGSKPSIRIKIRPFSSFVSDIHFCAGNSTIFDNCFDEYSIFDEDHYANLIKNKANYIEKLSEKTYDFMIRSSIEKKQRSFGNLLSISPNLIMFFFPKKIKYQKYFNEIYNSWAEMLLNTPVRLKLPGIPIGGNEKNKKEYKIKIKSLIYEYKQTYSFLSNLQSPIIISIVYRPAAEFEEKDIDNILLEYIFPTVNEVFRPPATMFGITEYIYNGVVVKIPLAKDMNGISIGYEILRVPNLKKEDDGELYLGFRLDSHHDSLMDRLDSIIDNYLTE